MQRVLVTGGAGYIGSHGCKALKQAGFEPVTFDNLVTGWSDAVKFGPFVQGDLLNEAALDDVFSTYDPIAVMHFAALSNVGESVLQPDRYWENNHIGSRNLLAAMARAGCDKIVFSSTCATYGEHDGIELTEHTEQRPINPYGASKLAVEQALAEFEMSDRIRSVIFRYFNVAGADPDGDIGEFHDPETHLIPLAIGALMGARPPLTLFGTDYDTKDGTCIRDYIHVTDLIDAHVAGLQWLLDGHQSERFNLGTGDGFTVKEVLDAAFEATGKEVPHKIGDRRDGDATKLVSGSSKAKNLLGWDPKHSSLHNMISTAWKWHKGPGYKQ